MEAVHFKLLPLFLVIIAACVAHVSTARELMFLLQLFVRAKARGLPVALLVFRVFQDGCQFDKILQFQSLQVFIKFFHNFWF